MALPTKTDLSTLILPGVKPVQYFSIANMFQEEYDALPSEFKDYYEYEEETRTYSLNELEWLRWRKHGPYHRYPSDSRYIPFTIGGSDIAVLFDGSKLSETLFLYDGQHGSNFKSSVELFYEKTERKFQMNEEKNNDIFWIGHNEEASIRSLFKKKFCDDHPLDIVKVINDCHMYQCGVRDNYGRLLYPFILCDLDGIVEINGIRGVLECKTCNKGSEDYQLWKQHIVPLKYYLQVCWYMACMNLPYGYIIAKWGLGISECTYIYIERNLEIEKLLIELGQEFIDALKKDKCPELSTQNINRLFMFWQKRTGNPSVSSPVVRLGREYKDTIFSLFSINDAINTSNLNVKRLKEQRNELLAREIFPLLDGACEAVVDYSPMSNMRIKLRNNKVKKVVDVESLKQTDPVLYQKFVKPVFDEKLFIKELENSEIAEEFIKEDTTLTPSKMDYCDISLEAKLRIKDDF